MAFHIVLVEPEIPQNTGNIARTCAATGAILHLVKPLGFSLDDRYVKRAGLDYWDRVRLYTYDSFEELAASFPGRRFFLCDHEGGQILHGVSISGWGSVGLRQGDGRPSRPTPGALSRHLYPHSDASRKPFPQPVQRGGHRALRGVAPKRFSPPDVKSIHPNSSKVVQSNCARAEETRLR